MRKLKRFLALIYFLSIFVGVTHELSHAHHIGETCSVCVLAHTPALAVDLPVPTHIDTPHESFDKCYTNNSKPLYIPAQSRSPPLS